MCGIWAIINRSGLTPTQLASFQKLKPRGPDHSVLHLYPNHVIGHHWLAIGPYTTKGQQPYYYHFEDYNYTIMVNGQIYNYRDVKEKYQLKTESDSDCGVVFPLFVHLKEDFEAVNRQLIGQYAIFITKENIKNGSVEYFLSVDALSVIPAFFFSSEHQFGCASLKAGLCSFGTKIHRADQGSFVHGIYYPETKCNKILEQKKYRIKPEIVYNARNIELEQKIVRILEETVSSRVSLDKPMGCLLSGGLDSSLIASISSQILKKNNKKLHTFSIGFKGSKDISHSREVSQYIGSIHTQYLVQPEQVFDLVRKVIEATESSDPSVVRSSLFLCYLAQKIAEQTKLKLVLSGDGADQSQMGLRYFYDIDSHEKAKNLRDKAIEQVHLFNGLGVERTFSHFGIEVRMPDLDPRFVDLFYQIDPKLLQPVSDNQVDKFLIRRAFETVKPQILPKDILWRQKVPFCSGISNKENDWEKIISKIVSSKFIENKQWKQEFDKKRLEQDQICLSQEQFLYQKMYSECFGSLDFLAEDDK